MNRETSVTDLALTDAEIEEIVNGAQKFLAPQEDADEDEKPVGPE